MPGTDNTQGAAPTNRSGGIARWLHDAPAVLVANPTAQSGRNAERIDRARLLLSHVGIAHGFLATLPGGGTVGAVRDALADGE
ncbi:MAG: hypothetical protein H7138_25145, partial [Myxococcales bacterium]|nr:hypothetical protein [Myxococcales bacterium]